MTDHTAAPKWLSDLYDELNRALEAAEAAHSVIEQVGLLQEALDGIGAGEMLRRILNGATFEEVRNG